jgi:hypothetical protein
LKTIAILVILNIVASIALKVAMSRFPGLSESRFDALLEFVMLALLTISTIKLITTPSIPVYYELIIEVAGTPPRKLVSTDKETTTSLLYQIMNAISDPQAEFQIQVRNCDVGGQDPEVQEHYHFGDEITQDANYNVGRIKNARETDLP